MPSASWSISGAKMSIPADNIPGLIEIVLLREIDAASPGRTIKTSIPQTGIASDKSTK
jgi:hypothetical protein